MKIAVIGCGSIGKRHIKNLLSIKQQVVAWNRGIKRRNDVKKEFSIEVYSNQKKLYEEFVPKIVYICSPTSNHIDDAILAAKYNCSIFIEKPLSHNLSKINILKKIVNKKKLITHIGCNLRFDPGPKNIKKILDSELLGNIIWSNFFIGSYLPDWHPYENYMKMYSAKKSLGGGAILDCIHEIDLIYWFFKSPLALKSLNKNSKSLKIETEDISETLMYFKNKSILNLHIDYLFKPPRRSINIIFSQGRIEWDLYSKLIQIHYRSGKYKKIKYPINWNINSNFIDQNKYFLNCVKKKKQSFSNIISAFEVLKIALKIKKNNFINK